MKKISIIVPMYNEEEMIDLFFEKMNKTLSKITNYTFEFVTVDDGSRDRTLELLKKKKEEQGNIHIVSFSRNFGHEAAVAAGFKYASGDVMIVMDADLQDPPEVILQLIEKYEEGYEVVNAKRIDRMKDPFMKRFTAQAFYKVIAKLSGKIKVPENVGNYRLLDRKVVDEINALSERNRVFRVEVPFVGYKTTDVGFVRAERPKGKTHYNYKNMFKLAGDSITSSSVAPLVWPFKWGIFVTLFNAIALLINIILYSCQMNDITFIPSYPSLVLFIIIVPMFVLGIMMIILGIFGMYLSRIMVEAQDRPVYIVKEDIK